MTKSHQIVRTVFAICIGMIGAFSLPSAATNTPVSAVSMVELIVGGEKYINRRIEVFGFLASNTSLQVYLSRDHAKAGDSVSSIEVSDTDEGDIHFSDCMSSYVIITGTLIELDHVLVLSSVEKIFQPSSSSFCWRQPNG
jgi:hypothetical protein